MTQDDIVNQLISNGYNNEANATQQDLYTIIRRGQLFSQTNRLNAGWARGKYIIAKLDDTQNSEQEYVAQWLDKVRGFNDQFLCLEINKNSWVFYDYSGNKIQFVVKPPMLKIRQSVNQGFIVGRSITYNKYRPFITAIKSKPFLLLAGISGTGKSRIVRELARACWDENSDEYKAQKPRNFKMVQVKPNWQDSSELIGYVSRIDGVRYVVGPFLRFMVKAMHDPDIPYFLCLDEMNLAPVEQYFAEYLSVIESRKRQDDGKIVTDPIVDYSNTEEYHSLISQLFDSDDERKAYLQEDGGKRLGIPPNLIVVGTVNMDETTFSFSRKVLDRAMTIEMNEVDLKGGLEEKDRHEKIGKLGRNELMGTAVEGVDVYGSHTGECNTAITYLQGINDVLEGTPFKVAYRTRNEFLLYVVNNLPYDKDKDGNSLATEFVIARALDEITNMKILSRIEGDETKVSKAFVDKLKETIEKGLETVCSTLFVDGYKSVSIAKLDEMENRLLSGYTSFWS